MQGYVWSSNQRPPPNYQERAPPQYQERAPPQYQEHAPPQYQQYPLQYQDQFPPDYQDFRNDQPNMFQAQFNTQFAANHCKSKNFRPNMHGYNTQTNRAHPQYPCAASNTQQHYPSENPNTYRCYAQFAMQSNPSSPQNYRNTGHNQAHMYWSPQSDHGSSVGNNRGWSSHTSSNGSSCSMNNQQQLQPPRTAPRHHQQHQLSRQHSGKQHNMHHRTQGHRQQSSSWAHNNGVSHRISNNQAPSRTTASYTSCNLTTPPSGAQSDISLPSNNLNQSPVNQNQPELRSNIGPAVSTIQSQNNQSTGQQSQGTNCGTHNVNETSQMTRTNEAQPQPHSRSYVNTLIYRLLCSNGNEQANKQQSVEGIAHQNTCSEQSEVCATNRTDQHSKEPSSEPSARCTVEPPSKRMKYDVVQRDYWNKETSVSKDFGAQSVRPGSHQTGSNEKRPKGMSLHSIQYSTDPADCLEAVFALQKVSQQVHKAIAIVPPISQQTSNTALVADTNPKKADSPPLKIDSVWTLVEESDAQKTVNDQLPESPSPTAQQEDKSLEIETTSNIADSDRCSTSPVECQNNAQQGDGDSSDASLDLSSVPVVKYTLEKLMDLVKSLEIAELSSRYPDESESFFNRILKLYWNGSQDNLVEALKSFRKEAERHSSVDIVWDYESVVFESIETENLKKLAHCDVLNNEMYSSSEEFRSSWLNVDGQPADIEKVLSEPLLDDITVSKATSQVFSDKTVVTSTNLGANSHKVMPEVSSAEKSARPDMCSPAALLKPQSRNDREEMATENNCHSYAGLSRMTYLSSVSSEKETFKKQVDINQNHNFNTKPSDNSPLAERSTVKLTDCSNEIEVFRQDHSERTCHNLSVSESLPLSPGNSVSDGVKNSDLSFSTETLCNSKDTWQIEDISDDENPGNKEALNNSSDIGLVEDISDAGNSGNKEVLNNTSDTWPVEDISDAENSGNEEVFPNSSDIWLVEDISEDENTGNKAVLPNSSDTWQVEDISEDENPGNKDTCINSSDICVEEDVSNDENSSDSLLMEITVLSSEDAKTFFQQLENEPECGVKTTTSTFDCPDLVACFDAPSQPNHEYNKADTCSLCGTKITISNSTNAMDNDGDHFCSQCWEQAPLLELEEEPCSPVKNEADVLGSPAKSNKQGQDCSPPCLKLEVKDVASTKECIVYERLTGQKSDYMVRLGLVQNSPTLELKVKELNVTSPETCTVDEGQKRDSIVKSELGEKFCPPCLDLQVKKPAVASLKESIGIKRLSGQKCEGMVKSELGQTRSPPPLDLKVKELTVTLSKKCIADEKRDCMVKSELGQNHSSPSLELKVNKTTVASTEERIDDEGRTGQKSQSLLKLEPRQNCSPPSLELQVKVPNVSSPEECTENNKRLTGQKRDCMVKSKLGQNCSRPNLELEVNEPTAASTEECTEDERLMGQKSESLLKSQLRQNCSSSSLEPQVKVPNVASPKKCIADEGLEKSVTQKVPEIQRPAEQELTKIQPNKQKNDKTEKNRLAKPQLLFKCNKPPLKKSAFFKHKLKSGSTRTGSDDSVLFTPDIVVKKNLPQKKKNLKRPSGESQDCSKVKKFKEHRQERQDYPDRTSQDHRETLQKVTEKVPGHSNDTTPHGSKKKLELRGILSVNKTKTIEPKKVRFDLYGSNREKQIYAHERRFSAPASLTVSDTCKDYTDVLSAKQKVLNQWSSTFIPKTKSFHPRSPQEGAPQKKKTQKTQDLLKLSISALKSHLTHRAKLQSSSEKETNHFRKPVFHRNLTKTLSG
ncbi:tubulin--tyrosine ligase-like protein 12 isoform X2 [Ctenopharyngodon idella]|uniref:tubulin--tyrosine ligase-like protein 12 isoform X2 n=1 Tax=Ctenopharyngodon idella TaxID=7959 RepID=UPI00223036A4|nr:tubulin--tyrosine ligase-like protein 12 isoform X2 [Ctenopharyngodon idella]